MTIPSTPSFMKRKPMKSAAASQIKPAEERELEKVAFYRKELARKRKIAEESCKIALAGKGPTAPVAPKHMTKPEEFKFETDARIKAPHPPPTVEEVKDFASCLRSDTGKQAPGPMKAGPTIPEPFKLSSGQQRKRKLPDLDEKQAEKYETMAEKLAAFTKTPDRFRSRPKGGASDEKRGRSRSPPHGPTVPHTPQFETRSRSRPVTAPSREEIEQQELEEMQKNQFKAQPLNTKIFQNPSLKKVTVKAPTVPEEFHLSHNLKAHDKEAKQEEEHYEFHAKPLNKKILEGTVGLKEPKRLPLTKPESPAFALKHRARIPAPEEQTEPEKPTTRRRPIPHTGVPFQIQLSHKTTEPEPFAFEEREKRRAVERGRKIEQILEEEAKNREFHAQPLPDHEPHLPPKRTRPLTVQKPFNLDTDVRGAKKTEEWLKKVLEEEELEAKEKTRFKAREPVVLDQEPFVPQKENKCTADITEFELSTAKRHLKREAYETSKKQRQDELDNIRHQEQLIREAEERAELERLRREAVHKAEPVKHYKSLPIRPSSKPLTEAMSPHFHTDERLRTRSKHSDSSLST
ncbi:targeting protein for Xklp2 homolog [Dreissena polymorpha]|uniref:targeting protein for Xklp2 homolog n=1 Tax=Dreissena polymorpha TaxID=45954 RepID=UPI0022656122|nr:targeting protein for Xklp2 homolog [Dreissena polymorpha]